MEEGQVANMYVTFLYSEGWNDNTLYYYTYSADETLTKEQILDRISDETKLFGLGIVIRTKRILVRGLPTIEGLQNNWLEHLKTMIVLVLC